VKIPEITILSLVLEVSTFVEYRHDVILTAVIEDHAGAVDEKID